MNVCLRLIKEGRFHPQSPGRIIEDSYQEILNQKQPLIGEYFMLFFVLTLDYYIHKVLQWFIYNFGLMGSGTRSVSHINESNCKLMSPEHYF